MVNPDIRELCRRAFSRTRCEIMHVIHCLSVVAKKMPLLLFIASLIGCGSHTYSSRLASQLATPTGPIAVEATVDGPASIATSLDNNTPRVTVFANNKELVVIELARIVVGGEAYPPAPAGTKKITVNVKNGQTTITADDKPITK
jgi:hypothetical protein